MLSARSLPTGFSVVCSPESSLFKQIFQERHPILHCKFNSAFTCLSFLTIEITKLLVYGSRMHE